MSEELANVPEGTVLDSAQLGTNPTIGESAPVVETKVEVGEPSVSPAESDREPGEELFDGKTAEQLQESYKALQTEFNNRNESSKALESRLNNYGGMDAVEQWLTFMNTDEGMANYIRQRQQEQVFGQPQEEISDEQKQAQDIVNSLVDQKIQALQKTSIEPLAQAYQQKLLEENMKIMDTTHGPEWRELQNDMLSLAKKLPESVQNNPSYEDIDDLYTLALKHSGRADEIAAKRYEKTLLEQRAKSQEKPISAVGKPANKKATTIGEAWAQAKAQLGEA
jgi:hypothetical protein